MPCKGLTRYKLYTDEGELDNYLSEALGENGVAVGKHDALSYLKAEYKLPKTLDQTEIYLKEGTLTRENFYQYISLYKALSSEYPVKLPIPQPMLLSLLRSASLDDSGYNDIIAIAIAYDEYDWRSEVTDWEDEKTVVGIARVIEDYATLGDLLIQLGKTNSTLLRQVCQRLIDDKARAHQLDLVEVLKGFMGITEALDIGQEEFLIFLSQWKEEAKNRITRENLEEVFADPDVYCITAQSETPIAQYINSLAIEFLSSVTEERWRKEYGEKGSYIYATLRVYFQRKQTSPPVALRKELKSRLKEMASGNISIPREGEYLYELYQEARGEDWTAALKDIRDEYCTSRSITPAQFLFFEPLLREWGALAERPKDCARRILEPVVNDETCRACIIGNGDFYIPIVKAAGIDAADLKEKIKAIARCQNGDAALRDFALGVGIKLDDEESE